MTRPLPPGERKPRGRPPGSPNKAGAFDDELRLRISSDDKRRLFAVSDEPSDFAREAIVRAVGRAEKRR